MSSRNDHRSGIYKITCVVTEKFYIGSAVSVHRRCVKHKTALNAGSHVNRKLQNAWNKYGPAAFVFEAIEYVERAEDLVSREQHWIDTLHSVARGYNLAATAGSMLGFKHDDESKKKMSAAKTGRKWTERQRELMILAKTGKKRPAEVCEKLRVAFTGRKFSDDTRAKMSEAGKRRAPPSDTTRAKLKASSTGRVFSAEACAKISAALAGKKRRAMSEQTKAIKSKQLMGRVWTEDEIARRVATRKATMAARQQAQHL